ncbi:MAG: copper resistance protein CopC, partial [Candidatus Kerfeldbacteria bacterium]|nr:copper resistance protein CopC [Candidatus Kerfeldbacteria bacterium]
MALFKRPARAPTVDSNVNALANVNSTAPTSKVFTETRTSTLVTTLPLNNAILAVSPNTVSLGFNNPIGPDSTITVSDEDGDPAHLGSGSFSDDRQTLTVLLRPGLRGPVLVRYSACNLEHVCEAGEFGFNIQ